jgi:hypothetical protein
MIESRIFSIVTHFTHGLPYLHVRARADV